MTSNPFEMWFTCTTKKKQMINTHRLEWCLIFLLSLLPFLGSVEAAGCPRCPTSDVLRSSSQFGTPQRRKYSEMVMKEEHEGEREREGLRDGRPRVMRLYALTSCRHRSEEDWENERMREWMRWEISIWTNRDTSKQAASMHTQIE